MQRFQSQVKWGSFPLNVAQFCFIYISPASDGWIPELSYFPFFFFFLLLSPKVHALAE